MQVSSACTHLACASETCSVKRGVNHVHLASKLCQKYNLDIIYNKNKTSFSTSKMLHSPNLGLVLIRFLYSPFCSLLFKLFLKFYP